MWQQKKTQEAHPDQQISFLSINSSQIKSTQMQLNATYKYNKQRQQTQKKKAEECEQFHRNKNTQQIITSERE